MNELDLDGDVDGRCLHSVLRHDLDHPRKLHLVSLGRQIVQW